MRFGRETGREREDVLWHTSNTEAGKQNGKHPLHRQFWANKELIDRIDAEAKKIDEK